MIVHSAFAVTQMPSCHRVRATKIFHSIDANKPVDNQYAPIEGVPNERSTA